MSYTKYFSLDLNKILKECEKLNNEDITIDTISTELFIWASLNKKECFLYKALNNFINSVSIDIIKDKVFLSIPKSQIIYANKINKKISISDDLEYTLMVANKLRIQFNIDTITSDLVLLAIFKQKKYDVINNIFASEGINYETYLKLCMELHDVTEAVSNIKEEDSEKKKIQPSKGPLIKIIGPQNMDMSNFQKDLMTMIGMDEPKEPKASQTYTTNLNHLAEIGKLDDIVGRTEDINKIIKAICKRKTNNVVIVGESGVGKSSIIEGLAKMIVDKTAPKLISDKTIFKANISEMVSGAQFRGMFEKRLSSVLKELKAKKNCILFIDDIHHYIGAKQKEDYDVISLLNETLVDKDVAVIATTTFKGYKSAFESNKDFERRFQKLIIEKPSMEDTKNIIYNIAPLYEKFHKVKISKDMCNLIINLSNKYITDRSLPASAVDILDEIGADMHMRNSETEEILNLKREKALLSKKKTSEEIEKKINDITIEISKKEDELKKQKNNITEEDVYRNIAEHTNIPVSKLNADDKKQLVSLNSTLKQYIIGQDEAIDTVTRAIKRNKIGLSKNNKPIYSCICIGNTGVGKTLMAKTLAREFMGGEQNLIRLDMSEYSDKTSVNKLLGSSAGYVGYERGGVLTEAVKNKKYAVILIDEIEKANEEIFNTFLQILDEGFISDNIGQKIDFKNTIIIMTSNVGVKRANSTKSMGFMAEDNDNKKDIITKELKNKFPPEFINRLDDVIYFNTLKDEDLKLIIKLELNNLISRLKNIKMNMVYNDEVVDYILTLIQKEKDYGARPIIRTIQNEIENKITDLIINNDYKTHNFNISLNKQEIIVN